MASFLLPSSIQKRLLRYALSRLELLDTDALDLEHLDISWGTRSTVEFRDVGVRLKKLANLLQLPSRIDLVKARILLLRITIPVDIYSSPIVVEVDGVEAHVRLTSDLDTGDVTPKSPTDHDRKRNRRDEKGKKSSSSDHDMPQAEASREEEDPESALPTAVDLAKSFLQTEVPEEKAELEAAMLQKSQNLEASLAYTDDGEEESAVGTGTSLSLPAFMANFLRGIVDRLQVRIHGISLDVDVDLSSEGLNRPDVPPATELITIQLRVDDVDIEGVTFDNTEPSELSGVEDLDQRDIHRDGKRRISLGRLRGALISDPSFFASMARSSALSSPSLTYSPLSEGKSKRSNPASIPRSSSRNSTTDDLVLTGGPVAEPIPSSQLDLSSSIISSDNGRFEDAVEDDADPEIGGSLSFDTSSDPGNSFFSQSAYLDQVTDSQFLDEDMEDDDQGPPFAAYAKRLSNTLGRSPLSTPRASVYMPPAPTPPRSYFDHPPSRAEVIQSTMISTKLRQSFAEYSASRSRPLSESMESITHDRVVDNYHDTSLTPGPIDEGHSPEGSDSSIPLGEDDLAQSTIFSHEDAESMYMSALSHGSVSAKVPGAWGSSTMSSSKSTSIPTGLKVQQSHHDFQDNLQHALRTVASGSKAGPFSNTENTGSLPSNVMPIDQRRMEDASNTTPDTEQASSPFPLEKTVVSSSAPSNTSSDEYAKVAKQIFNIDQVTIYVPSDTQAPNDSDGLSQSTFSANTVDEQNSMASSTSPNVPGAFSVYAARQRSNSPLANTKLDKPSEIKVRESNESIEVALGRLEVQFDVSVARLIARLTSVVLDAISAEKPGLDNPPNLDQNKLAPPNSSFQFGAGRISFKFLERLAATTISSSSATANSNWIKPQSQDVLLRTTLKGLDISVARAGLVSTTSITLQKFVLGYAKENIISFNANFQMRASTRDLPSTAGVDLTVKITQSPVTSHVKITTLPVHVAIDLQRLDETFSWFGGLSSVLNMGSSIASNATVTLATPTKIASKSRSVRFEAPSKKVDNVSPQFKLYARVGGFVLDLVGRNCTVGMDTTAVKIVGRDEVIGLSIDKIKISGPHLRRSQEVPAILAELSVTRVQFMSSPENEDLEKLLSLITPSKAKYDRGDDILLDTLLRQRRQGSVLRIAVDNFSTQVKDLEDLKYLPELGEEVSRLSTVAKYLPEDDRPGLLSLLLVRNVDVQVSVDQSLGSFSLHAGDFEAAHITFPTLLALSVNTASIHRNKEELLGAATDIELREVENRSPAIMARIIGDEMEPVIKIKLWNLRAEYSVPLVVAILGLSKMPTTEELVESITTSVATLRDLSRPAAPTSLQKEYQVTKELNASHSKPVAIDVGLQECVLALNPMELPSKVLVVMTEAHLSAILPKDNNTSATFELAKGSLLVIDDVKNILPSVSPKLRRRSFDGGSTQVADLCSMGFVSVSYISSAKVVIRVSSSENDSDKYIDVELRDDLLVLESCADSTNTLITTLNSLKPPTLPSNKVKYRTKVVPVQDLLASLSGDAFGTAEGNYDFDEDFGPGLHKGSRDADEDESSELGFDPHYYQDEDSLDHNEAEYEDSRDGSVLFDQLASHDTVDGVLLEGLQEQEQIHAQEELDFHEDHFGRTSTMEGTAHQWNSAKNTYERVNDIKARKGPLRVCVRDVHIIWNLFDGYDWQHTRDTITKAVDEIHSKAIERRARADRRPTFDQDIAEEETVIGDFLFNSIYIGIPANRDPRELANAINQELNDNATETESVITTAYSGSPSRQGGTPRIHGKKLRLRRSKHHKITFELKGVSADLITFPPESGETESSIDIRVHDFDIYDHVPTSTWKKFATYMHDAGERESGTSQIHLEILNVKPIPELAASEIVLKATVLPLRLHVDQDALDFITRFFEFKDDSEHSNTSEGDVPFLQRVEVNSIPVKLDFKPKRVDYAGLRSGHTTEFMNFIVLDEADMVLRHTIIYGISGFDKLGKTLNDIWMPDIKRNQLPGILAGLAPVRSLANVGGGMRDLVVIPMREYRKDGRIVRSISKGAISFARTTGTELVKLGAKLAIGTQTVLQGAEEFLSKPGTPSSPSISAQGWEEEGLDEEEHQKQISAYADQPIGVVQGLRGGYASLERDLLMARDAIIAVPGEVMESGNAQAAVGAVLRRAPTVILRPVMGVTKALGQTLMGATNSLDPQNRRRVEDKYKKH